MTLVTSAVFLTETHALAIVFDSTRIGCNDFILTIIIRIAPFPVHLIHPPAIDQNLNLLKKSLDGGIGQRIS